MEQVRARQGRRGQLRSAGPSPRPLRRWGLDLALALGFPALMDYL